MIEDRHIFCIGLPRTGTRSFCAAMTMLGARHVVHAPLALEVEFYKEPGVYADTPLWAPSMMGKLKAAYPLADFIWTARTFNGWRDSMLRLFQHNTEESSLDPHDRLIYSELFSGNPFPLTDEKLQVAWKAHANAAIHIANAIPINALRHEMRDWERWAYIFDVLNIKYPHITERQVCA